MNQGKQKMWRMNIDILGISKLKWTGMGEFNSDDHYICYCGQESLRRNWVALIVKKRVQNAVLGYNLKNDRMISVSKANHSISQQSKCIPQPLMPKKLKLNSFLKTYKTSRTKNTQKDVLFIIGDWNAKVESQEIPGVTGKFSLRVQNEAGQRQTEFYQENALVIANTLFQQYKRQLYTLTSQDGQYWNQIDYILCS